MIIDSKWINLHLTGKLNNDITFSCVDGISNMTKPVTIIENLANTSHTRALTQIKMFGNTF